MNCSIRFVGVVDTADRAHVVELSPGVNIITGKSSTGKSAIIEIVDYCFGSSDFTIPDGVITKSAQLYFLVLTFPSTSLVLARRADGSRVFIKEERDGTQLAKGENFKMAYFVDDFFIPLADYNKELGRYFGITMSDVDEVPRTPGFGRPSKSPTPSVRTLMSFMLQHQNLIANKHAIFYRFDEKEKREQAIEHFKILMGYADQSYFLTSQRLAQATIELRRIEFLIPRAREETAKMKERVSEALNEYSSITGSALVSEKPDELLQNPARWLPTIAQAPVAIRGAGEEFATQRKALDESRSTLMAELRRLERERELIRSSLSHAARYIENASTVQAPEQAEIHVSECPFCRSKNENLEGAANKLEEAINWLNDELSRSPYVRESFEVDEQKIGASIASRKQQLAELDIQIGRLEAQTAQLAQGRSAFDLAVKAKVRVEYVLEESANRTRSPLDDQKKKLEDEVRDLTNQLKTYGVDAKLQAARAYIEAAMADIGARFDFEESYRPINLKFSLDTFDLWHESPDGRQVFLRAMGSGANWLYSHLTLFLALNQLFCEEAQTCKIPPILLLDQPSQVYFPSFASDTDSEFKARDLSEKAGKVDRANEDLDAVTNIFSELIDYCHRVQRTTGILPQLIVTDHADKLNLGDATPFESFVRARWRTHGLINPIP